MNKNLLNFVQSQSYANFHSDAIHRHRYLLVFCTVLPPEINSRMQILCGRNAAFGCQSRHIFSGRFDKLSDPVKAAALFPVTGEDRIVGVDAAVTEERPAAADIFSAVEVDVNDLHALIVGVELSQNLTLRACGE